MNILYAMLGGFALDWILATGMADASRGHHGQGNHRAGKRPERLPKRRAASGWAG